jgi:hypothetical protein
MIKTRKIGGMRFIWIGRLVISYCVTRPKNPKAEKIKALKSNISKAKANLKLGVVL